MNLIWIISSTKIVGKLTYLVQIDIGYACAGIEVTYEGTCVNAAPIFKWMINKDIALIKNWIRLKSGSMLIIL